MCSLSRAVVPPHASRYPNAARNARSVARGPQSDAGAGFVSCREVMSLTGPITKSPLRAPRRGGHGGCGHGRIAQGTPGVGQGAVAEEDPAVGRGGREHLRQRARQVLGCPRPLRHTHLVPAVHEPLARDVVHQDPFRAHWVVGRAAVQVDAGDGIDVRAGGPGIRTEENARGERTYRGCCPSQRPLPRF